MLCHRPFPDQKKYCCTVFLRLKERPISESNIVSGSNVDFSFLYPDCDMER